MRRKIIKHETQPGVKLPYLIKNITKIIRQNIPIRPSNKATLNETTTLLTRKSDRVFILGGGSSLIDLDISFLQNEDVICVNKAIDLVKNPKYFITMDYSFFTKIGKSVKEITALAQNSHFIVNRQHSYLQKINELYTDTRSGLRYEGLEHFTSVISSFKETTEISGFGQELGEFCHGSNSGYCAIQFAIIAGYTEIYLLGFDLQKPADRKQTHFHKSYPNFRIDKFYKNLNTYKKFILESIVKIKEVTSTSIYTLTPSALEPIVPKVSVDTLAHVNSVVHETRNIIGSGLNNLVVVAYYTINTPYEAEALKLVKSLNKLNLIHDVIGVTNLGNWQANTRFKAKFMEDMLNKHQGKNLLYVDTDAIVHSRPVLFENYTADIAVRWQDFRWRKNECLSGTIFMANNDKTRELCQRWQQININEGPGATTFEQWNLGTVIKEMESEGKINTKNLPPEYTMIFDSMRAIYPDVVPVIEHFQASRKLKNRV